MFLLLVVSAFSTSGCDMLSFLEDDKATLEDFFTAAKNSVGKDEYTVKNTGSSQRIDEDGFEPSLYNITYLKNNDGYYVFSQYDDENEIVSSWTKTTYEGTTFYDGNIWLYDYSSWDSLHDLTEEKFNEEYGNVGSLITVLTASDIGDLFGVAVPDGEVEVEGTYSYNLKTEDKQHKLSIEVKDYIYKLDLSGSESYQKMDMKMEFTFSNGYVNKVALDYIEDPQKKLDDGTFVDSTALFDFKSREINVYEIEYSFDQSKIQRLLDITAFTYVLDVSAIKEAYTINNTYTTKKVSGYGNDNGKVNELNTVTTYGSEGYFTTGDKNDEHEIWGIFYDATKSQEYYNAYVCAGDVSWCDPLGQYSNEEIAEDYGKLHLSGIPFLRYYYNAIYPTAYEFVTLDVGYTGLYIENVNEYGDVDFDYTITTLQNGDKKIKIDIVDNIINKINTYSYNDEGSLYKKSGYIEFIYNSNELKEINVYSNEKEGTLNGETFVENGKVMEFTSKYEISYTYDSTVKEYFPEEYR